MRQRLESESRLPGMHGNRQCLACGERLEIHEFERCTTCRPALSAQARATGETRRREREEIEQAERQIGNLQGLLRKLNRRLAR